MSYLLPMLHTLAPYAAMALGSFIVSRLRKPRDHERAELLSRIADAVAASVVASMPSSEWVTLAREIEAGITRVLRDTPYPTAAVQRETVRALSQYRKAPGVA